MPQEQQQGQNLAQMIEARNQLMQDLMNENGVPNSTPSPTPKPKQKSLGAMLAHLLGLGG